MADVDWEAVEAVNVQPSFVPPVSSLWPFLTTFIKQCQQ